MKTESNVISTLVSHLFNSDIFILFTAFITLFFMIVTIGMSRAIKKRVNDWKKQKNETFSKFLLYWSSKCYTIFTTMITLFPMLGMLGTVFGLLGINMESEDMESIKRNFFVALTSTAWGIIFSVIFKVLHAFIADGVEESNEIAKKLSEE